MYTKRSEKKKMSMSPLLGVKKEVLYPSKKYKSKVCVCVSVFVFSDFQNFKGLVKANN